MSTQEDFDNECRGIVQRIGNELYDIAHGTESRVCPECGFTTDEETCPDCKCDTNEMTMWDYFDDCLDVRYIVDSRFDYLGAIVTVGWGGPNIYVDTWHGQVELYWGGTHETWGLDRHTIAEIDEVFEEYASMARM